MGKKHSISLRDLCQLFERLNNGVFFWDRNLRLIACNRIACRLYGLDPGFMTEGRDFREMVEALPPGRLARESPPERWQPIAPTVNRERILDAFRQGGAFEIVFPGNPPRALIGARATFREGILASVVTDVTDREEAARTIERQWSYLETMIENLDDGIALVDEAGRCIAFNGRLLSLCEIAPETVKPGDPIERLLGEGPCATTEAGEGPLPGERRDGGAFRVMREAGREIEIRHTALSDGRAVIVARDVTARVGLARRRAQLATIVDNIGEGTALIDRDGRLVAFNAQFLDHFGVLRGSVRPGDHVSRLIALQRDLDRLPLEEQGRRRAERLDFILGQQERRAEARDELGTGCVLAVTRTPLDGGALFTYRDVTAEEERRALLERARREAEKASRMQSEFLARMSHELRTPMQGVLGMAALLERSDLDDGQRRSLDVIRASGRHMLALIEDLLTVSTLDADAMRLHPRPVPLTGPIEDALDMVRPQARERGLTLDFDGAAGAGVVVEADDTRLRQIVLNLLGNAVRYTEEGGITLRLRTGPGGEEGVLAVEIEVGDTGPGIPAGEQGEIFERFRQLDRPGGVKEGVGLGLPVARSLARLMGGDVTVRSEPGQGATFTARLTLRRAGAPA